MNYEEMLAARQGGKKQHSRICIGDYYREQTDGKWHSVVDIHNSLNANISFSKALRAECDANLTILDSHQIHFSPVCDARGDVVRLDLEQGNYLSFSQFLEDNPSIVANKLFLRQLLSALADVTTRLNARGIYHVCFSPSSVFIRKGDNLPMVLSHGSYYMSMSDLPQFYAADARFVAPEVLSHGTVDCRCDVYSLGKFFEAIFETTEMPREFRPSIQKATQAIPEDRYASVADFQKSILRRQNVFRSVLTAGIALAIAALVVGIYFESFPETLDIEYVKPAPRQATDDLLDDGFDPSELGVVSADSAIDVDWESERAFEAKAEEIFRKKYETEANRVLSKIYNKNYMSNSEKRFMAESKSTIEELMQLQQQLGEESGLNSTRAQLIATEIIERLTEQKKKEMGGTNKNGVQLPEKK